MATPTLEDIATWPEPNYDNPRDVLDPVVWGVGITLMILATIFISCRFYSRFVVVRNALGLDDWTMLLAYIFAMGIAIVHIMELKAGYGRHLYDVKLEWLPLIAKWGIVTQVVFGPAAALTKISICLTYLRIFPSRTNSQFNYICIVVVAAWGVICSLTSLFQCWPMSDTWNLFRPIRHCINLEVFIITTTSMNSFTDCLVFLWPVYYLWNIKMSLNKRVWLIISFSLGVIVCIGSVVRVVYMVKYFRSWDVAYNSTIVYVISDVEICLGIICGCLPGIRPVIRKLFPTLIGSSDHPSTAPSGRRHTDLGYSGPLSSQQSRNAGYRDIHVTLDVEMKASPAPTKTRTLRNISDDESQEWIFKTDIQNEVRTDIRGPSSQSS
ncbi:hypothetical protein P152DRAFT_150824 [Eremomyces bilateralis CBS 781.70]|uniref:Rhodopsin domain-containing protein n=1 Tax=Eremomyces bilateralis CBS 781.70 TaxID=1392243 RepID=A0A6G1FVU8_9PEZI|nr:uncharacterized protein P152DRAFT_150824 [Eremomyces bilateralis CBS 781.70]KAF1809812.1 hypothetical protein P152DRAFT_150824 [Eremomyces bilateralis CBS 781.70]